MRTVDVAYGESAQSYHRRDAVSVGASLGRIGAILVLPLLLAGCATTAPVVPTSVAARPASTASVAGEATAVVPLTALAPSPSPRPAAPSSFDLAIVREGSVWLARLDGSTLRLSRGGQDAEPRWSGDGTRVLFIRGSGAAAELYVVQAEGGAPRRLTDDRLEQRSPRWSPRGDLIAYVQPRDANGNGAGDPEEDSEIWLMRPDGSGVQKLVDGFDPAWSPDGARLAYVSNGRRRAEAPVGASDNAVRVIEHQSRTEREVLPLARVPQRLEASHGFPFDPTSFRLRAPGWSPDGRRLAASVDGHAGMALTVNEGGGELKVWLLNYEGGLGRTIFAPRGSLLAVESDPATGYRHVILVETASGRRVDLGSERLDVSVSEPEWAPDGLRLAATVFSGAGSSGGREQEIVIFDVLGSPVARVAAGEVSQPDWNPRR
jgi:Tol biopolymer transport system component